MSSINALVLLTLSALTVVGAHAGGLRAGGGWFPPSSVPSMDSATFHTQLAPLFQAATLTYTATFGTYYNPLVANNSINGFSKSHLESNPPMGGMRALVFVENNGGNRVLVAFRGTDLNSTTPGGQSDLCADQILFDNITNPADMYPFCASIPPAQLDYYIAAKAFLRSVLTTYPAPYEVLMTGHSLGAGLSNMMVLSAVDPQCFPPQDAARIVGSVVMSSPAFILPIMERVQAPYPASAATQEALSKRITTLADAFDPVYMVANKHPIGLLGQVCKWVILPEPISCSICQLDPSDSSTNLPCQACFVQRHIYSHYLHTFQNATLMPVCEASPRTPCSNPTNALACTGHGSDCQ